MFNRLYLMVLFVGFYDLGVERWEFMKNIFFRKKLK